MLLSPGIRIRIITTNYTVKQRFNGLGNCEYLPQFHSILYESGSRNKYNTGKQDESYIFTYEH